MWVFEETLPSGGKLSTVINQSKVNLSNFTVVVDTLDLKNSLDGKFNFFFPGKCEISSWSKAW